MTEFDKDKFDTGMDDDILQDIAENKWNRTATPEPQGFGVSEMDDDVLQGIAESGTDDAALNDISDQYLNNNVESYEYQQYKKQYMEATGDAQSMTAIDDDKLPNAKDENYTPKYDFFGAYGLGLQRGWAEFGSGFYADVFSMTQRLGMEDFSKWADENAEIMQKMAEDIVTEEEILKDIRFKPEVLTTPQYWGYSLGRQTFPTVAQLATAYVSGQFFSAVGAAAQAAPWVKVALVKAGQMIAGGYIGMFGELGPENAALKEQYPEMSDEDRASILMADKYALVATNTLEIAPFLQNMGFLGRLAMGAGANVAGEYSEEVLFSANKYAYGYGTIENVQETFSAAVNVIPPALLTAVLMGGATALVNFQPTTKAEAEIVNKGREFYGYDKQPENTPKLQEVKDVAEEVQSKVSDRYTTVMSILNLDYGEFVNRTKEGGTGTQQEIEEFGKKGRMKRNQINATRKAQGLLTDAVTWVDAFGGSLSPIFKGNRGVLYELHLRNFAANKTLLTSTYITREVEYSVDEILKSVEKTTGKDRGLLEKQFLIWSNVPQDVDITPEQEYAYNAIKNITLRYDGFNKQVKLDAVSRMRTNIIKKYARKNQYDGNVNEIYPIMDMFHDEKERIKRQGPARELGQQGQSLADFVTNVNAGNTVLTDEQLNAMAKGAVISQIYEIDPQLAQHIDDNFQTIIEVEKHLYTDKGDDVYANTAEAMGLTQLFPTRAVIDPAYEAANNKLAKLRGLEEQLDNVKSNKNLSAADKEAFIARLEEEIERADKEYQVYRRSAEYLDLYFVNRDIEDKVSEIEKNKKLTEKEKREKIKEERLWAPDESPAQIDYYPQRMKREYKQAIQQTQKEKGASKKISLVKGMEKDRILPSSYALALESEDYVRKYYGLKEQVAFHTLVNGLEYQKTKLMSGLIETEVFITQSEYEALLEQNNALAEQYDNPTIDMVKEFPMLNGFKVMKHFNTHYNQQMSDVFNSKYSNPALKFMNVVNRYNNHLLKFMIIDPLFMGRMNAQQQIMVNPRGIKGTYNVMKMRMNDPEEFTRWYAAATKAGFITGASPISMYFGQTFDKNVRQAAKETDLMQEVGDSRNSYAQKVSKNIALAAVRMTQPHNVDAPKTVRGLLALIDAPGKMAFDVFDTNQKVASAKIRIEQNIKEYHKMIARLKSQGKDDVVAQIEREFQSPMEWAIEKSRRQATISGEIEIMGNYQTVPEPSKQLLSLFSAFYQLRISNLKGYGKIFKGALKNDDPAANIKWLVDEIDKGNFDPSELTRDELLTLYDKNNGSRKAKAVRDLARWSFLVGGEALFWISRGYYLDKWYRFKKKISKDDIIHMREMGISEYGFDSQMDAEEEYWESVEEYEKYSMTGATRYVYHKFTDLLNIDLENKAMQWAEDEIRKTFPEDLPVPEMIGMEKTQVPQGTPWYAAKGMGKGLSTFLMTIKSPAVITAGVIGEVMNGKDIGTWISGKYVVLADQYSSAPQRYAAAVKKYFYEASAFGQKISLWKSNLDLPSKVLMTFGGAEYSYMRSGKSAAIIRQNVEMFKLQNPEIIEYQIFKDKETGEPRSQNEQLALSSLAYAFAVRDKEMGIGDPKPYEVMKDFLTDNGVLTKEEVRRFENLMIEKQRNPDRFMLTEMSRIYMHNETEPVEVITDKIMDYAMDEFFSKYEAITIPEDELRSDVEDWVYKMKQGTDFYEAEVERRSKKLLNN